MSVVVSHSGPVSGATAPMLVRPRRRRLPVVLWIAVGWIAIVVLAAVLADLLPIHSYAGFVPDMHPRAGLQLSREFLGTDAIGRSELGRIVYGGRLSLTVGLCSVTLAMVVGLAVGTAAGYFRGRADDAVRLVLDAALSLPALVVLLAIASVGSRDLPTLVVALALVTTPQFARLARANTMALTERSSIAAARTLGATDLRILGRELLPEVALRVSSFSFLVFAQVIVAEGTLSFLGLGISPPTPSWGGMVNDARPYLATSPHLVFIPSICLLLTVVAFTIVGDWFRRRFDGRGSALA